MDTGSQLMIKLGGTTQGSQYNLLALSGGSFASVIGGNLNVKFINGFQSLVNNGMGFIVVTSQDYDLSGSFSNIANGARLMTSDGYGSFLVSYGSGADTRDVRLSDFQPVPEPTSCGFAVGIGLVAFAAFRRRKQTAGLSRESVRRCLTLTTAAAVPNVDEIT
jgi:hypothetical protein